MAEVSNEPKDNIQLMFACAQRIYKLLPPGYGKQDLEGAYRDGLLRKEQLVDGKYYLGRCRNAKVAKWDAEYNCFVHMREKFGSHYAEPIVHPADDRGFDIFTAVIEVEPKEEEKVLTDSWKQNCLPVPKS